MNNFTHKLYILTENDNKYLQLFNELSLPNIELTTNKAQATILLASPPKAAEQIEAFESLEWLQSIYAGVDTIVPKLNHSDVLLTNVKGIFGQQISEYVLGYLLQHYRDLNQYAIDQTQAKWHPRLYKPIKDQVMVILGTGSIGSYLAQVAKAFGIKTLGVNRSGIPTLNSPFDETFHVQELDSALVHANILVNTLPSTPETKHLLNQDKFNHCHDALLFNVGRGSVVCEKSLLEALDQGNIQHAFLDVFELEPLQKSHPFWQDKRITVTPHISALSQPESVIEIFAENYHRLTDGFHLLHEVDLEKGY
ncbi:D-2-hydroxyacid dehydrogenase [Vibrio intestinalis]|uniref:D-2-hydroxyacid dehydrogenase n=1 Tax=Vibrio intestinalis TaxID=2933291 RepID=UPI0021A799C8|nr:D-2-hydroxyacid dehydrogenase [Vibrio intestinalis]